MSFVPLAKDFLNDPGELANDPRIREMQETVRFLIGKGVIGVGKGVPIAAILQHLRSKRLRISRGAWQRDVLGPLRDRGVWIGTTLGRSGMFLIETRQDAEAVRRAFEHRVTIEARRLKKLNDTMKRVGWM